MLLHWLKHSKIQGWEYNRFRYVKYIDNQQQHRLYFPDFIVTDLSSNQYFIEVKGRLTEKDILKMNASSVAIELWMADDILSDINTIKEYMDNKD